MNYRFFQFSFHRLVSLIFFPVLPLFIFSYAVVSASHSPFSMWESCDEARLPAGQDPDVVGLGTLIACAGSACIAVLCLVVQYLLFYLPEGQGEQQSCTGNPIDVLLLGGFRRPFEYLGIRFGWLATPRHKRRWPAAFDEYILALGDVQLAIGFSVLAYGYVTLVGQGLSVYYWWLIMGLVWFSVVTNLATTSYLRAYFDRRDPSKRRWRTFLLICLVAALSFSMVPIYPIKERLAHEPNEETRRRIVTTTNVLCYMAGDGARIDSQQYRSAIALLGIAVGVTFIVMGILRLCERPSSIIFKWRDHYRGEMEQSFFGDGDIITCIRCEQRHLLLVIRPILAFWLVLRVYADLLNSVLTEVFCAAATLTWVTVRFIDILRLGGSFEADSQRWSFGQVAALVFFAAPFGSLVGRLCRCFGGFRLRSQLPELPRLRNFGWFPNFAKKTQPVELQSENGTDERTDPPSHQSEPVSPEGTTELVRKDNSSVVETGNDIQDGRSSSENVEDESTKMYDVGSYKVLLSPRFVIALPLVGFANLLHLVLLLVLPKVSEYMLTADVLWRTIFWYIVYQPLLLFAFFLAGMIVEERVTRERRMRIIYRVIGAITALLSTAAILDTLYGLGGIPMSYIGMGTLGLILLVYLLYGCVARPGPRAKGKGRSRYPRGSGSRDVEEGEPLLSETRRKPPEIRIPVRKQKRWHGPSRRPQVTRGRKSYGTMD
ncbi:hypothetical protein F4818DRAFT_430383 [Hypoxylon cercidicola]|nr:hypothetical protein F4818DRAFT_430383 [Hypoxylon cercidicola]